MDNDLFDQTQRSKINLTERGDTIFQEELQTFGDIESPTRIPGSNTNLRNEAYSNAYSRIKRSTSSLKEQAEVKRKVIRETLQNFQKRKLQRNESEKIESSSRGLSNSPRNNFKDISLEDLN